MLNYQRRRLRDAECRYAKGQQRTEIIHYQQIGTVAHSPLAACLQVHFC